MPHPPGGDSKSLSWRKKIAFAAITTAGFFLLAEFGLLLFGVDPLTRSGDPFVGFVKQIPVLESDQDSSGNVILKTAENKLAWFNPQSFSAKKQANTMRVVCLGGSTTFGRPFDDRTSFCGWLREFLPLVDPDTQWEVINAGGVSYASYRVAVVMEEFAKYDPDLFIVYTGQNEYLESRTYGDMAHRSSLRRSVDAMLRQTRTWAAADSLVERFRDRGDPSPSELAMEVDERLNYTIGPRDYHRDPVWQKDVLAHFDWNLSRMTGIAQRCGARILFVTPSSNLRDCSPFKSETLLEGDSVRASEFGDQLELAKLLMDDGEHDAALNILDRLIEVDDRHAETHFIAGRVLFALGQTDLAATAFRRAVDEDVCPLRATTSIVNTVRRVARAQEDTMLVDFETKLLSQCKRDFGHTCIGNEYFLDHVHPTIDVHRKLALWLIDELRQSGWVRGSIPSDESIREVQRKVIGGIDRDSHGVAMRNLAKVLHWSGKFAEAVPRARDALKLIPNDPESRFLLADCLVNTGHGDEAFDQYTALFERHEYPRAFLPFGELLAARGDLGAAKAYLLKSLMSEREDHRVRAHFALGLVHSQLGEYEFAVESMEEVLRRHPEDAGALAAYAEAKRALGTEAAAETSASGERPEKDALEESASGR